jgi:hypothetical protein
MNPQPDRSEPARLCDAFIEIEGNPWAGTYCKSLAGHDGPCSPHYRPDSPPDEGEGCA